MEPLYDPGHGWMFGVGAVEFFGYLVENHFSVHYYDWAGTKLSPFHHDASHWGLGKPIVVGEFGVPEDALFGIPADSLYHKLYEGGYAGALVWQWIDWYADRGEYGESWLRGLELMEGLSEKYPNAVQSDG